MITLENKAREIIAIWESKLGQSIPLTDRSFLYQLSLALASMSVGVDKKADLEVRENLAITATRNALTQIGRNYLARDPYSATPATMKIELAVGDGVVVPVGTKFLAAQNNITYASNGTVIGDISGVSEIDIVSELSGGNTTLEIGSTVAIQGPIIGVGSAGNVVAAVEVGLSEEGTEEYRAKVLDAVRYQGGGSNMWDYRLWAQTVQGVQRAYPYGGKFDATGAQIGGPSDRTVYVQATESIDPDGIAPQSLLDLVRATLITDPSNNRNRICLGVPDSTLYVESIRRVGFDVKVYGTSVDWPSEALTTLDEAIRDYFFNIIPYIEGLDPVTGRVSEITPVNLSNVVHDALVQYGVSASSVEIFLTGEATAFQSYILPAGALAKAIDVNYL
jgi:hypothetical protein